MGAPFGNCNAGTGKTCTPKESSGGRFSSRKESMYQKASGNKITGTKAINPRLISTGSNSSRFGARKESTLRKSSGNKIVIGK